MTSQGSNTAITGDKDGSKKPNKQEKRDNGSKTLENT